MKIDAEIMPVARVFYLGKESVYPGWYVQHYRNQDLLTTRLELEPDVDAFSAVSEACGYLGCVPEQIQLEGVPWPPRQLLM